MQGSRFKLKNNNNKIKKLKNFKKNSLPLSLPCRFRAKETVIEENKDIDSIRVHELMESL